MSNDDILKIKMKNINKGINDAVDLLKCCGNCAHMMMPPACALNKQEKFTEFLPFRCCGDWNYDGLELQSRIIETEQNK